MAARSAGRLLGAGVTGTAARRWVCLFAQSKTQARLAVLSQARGSVRGLSHSTALCSTSSSASLGDDVDSLVRRLNRLPTAVSEDLVASLSPEARGTLVAALAKHAYASTPPQAAFQKLLEQVDTNKDGSISSSEFSAWVSRYHVLSTEKTGGMAAASAAAAAKAPAASVPTPTKTQLSRLFMRGMVPMVGFGFVDNFVMLTAGDTIDASLGVTLQITTLAAAGLGNLVSDVAGLMLNHGIEGAASSIGLKSPNLTPAQVALPLCRRLLAFASIVGISVGCLLGMVPLLFMDTERRELNVLFTDIDTDESGTVELESVPHAAMLFGVKATTTAEIAEVCVAQLGERKDLLTFEEFERIMKKLKASRRPWWMFW
eukprot:m.29783 g.29783  ORF g.29783 m.29783 type:complete len:373 (-) comp9272_c0_seq2:70-1188(-)